MSGILTAIGPCAMVWVIAAPLLAACASLVLRRRSAAIGMAFAAAIAGLVVVLGRQVLIEGPQHVDVGGWGDPLGIRLQADGLSVFLLGVTALIGGFVSMYAAAYFRPREGRTAHDGSAALFWPLWMFLWAALNALFLAADIFNVYVALEMLGLSAVALVALSDSAPAVSAAMRYLMVSLLGSLCYLMGVAFLYCGTGALSASALAQAVAPAPYSYAALALMSTGLLMKSALFPLHFWLPPAHANAPAPVSALLSALVVKASFYILLRLWFGVFPSILTAQAVLIPGILGAAAVLWGSIQALAARRLKPLIAYSTVAQVGYLFLVFPLGISAGAPWTAWKAALYFVASHASAKAAVFLAAGNVQKAFGHDRIEDLGGCVQALPVSLFAFAVAAVSLIGLPPSGGFIAKWMFLQAALERSQWGFAAVILAGGLMATAYIFRFFSLAFRNAPHGFKAVKIPRRMEWSAFGLAACAILLGLTGTLVIDLLDVGVPATGPAWVGGRP
jgi:formate hydrogenlyase subunit 3/multisubunit Na+/H+ antiporter MnhD subunit